MRERENKQTNKTRNEETHHKNKNNLRHLASSLFKLKEKKKRLCSSTGQVTVLKSWWWSVLPPNTTLSPKTKVLWYFCGMSSLETLTGLWFTHLMTWRLDWIRGDWETKCFSAPNNTCPFWGATRVAWIESSSFRHLHNALQFKYSIWQIARP